MSDTAQILQLERTRYQAMVNNDVVLLDRLLSDRLVYTHSTGRRDTKESYLATLRSNEVAYRDLHHDVDGARFIGGVAIIEGSMTGSVVSRSGTKRLNIVTTSIWANDEGPWRLVVFHSSPMAGQ